MRNEQQQPNEKLLKKFSHQEDEKKYMNLYFLMNSEKYEK
jgi:hypothetical protein